MNKLSAVKRGNSALIIIRAFLFIWLLLGETFFIIVAYKHWGRTEHLSIILMLISYTILIGLGIYCLKDLK
jgi:hypothetical protein